MSSTITAHKMSDPSIKFLFKSYLVNQDEPEENKTPETPEEKPTEQKSMWKPGGYTPTRASWHATRGKIKSYFS